MRVHHHPLWVAAEREAAARPSREWREMVKPIVQKCRLAVKLDMNITFNTDGSAALADLLDRMATTLDEHC
jgi:hypothetical protein